MASSEPVPPSGFSQKPFREDNATLTYLSHHRIIGNLSLDKAPALAKIWFIVRCAGGVFRGRC
jgi:hypothetical protein